MRYIQPVLNEAHRDSFMHLTSYGNGPGDHGFDDPIASHSSWVRNFLGFKAPLA
jgi:hypothetical protein